MDICPDCGHGVRLHSREGCVDTLPDGTPCTCTITYMDLIRRPEPPKRR